MKIRPAEAKFYMRMDTRTNRHDKANSRFLQVCEHTKATHKYEFSNKIRRVIRSLLIHFERLLSKLGLSSDPRNADVGKLVFSHVHARSHICVPSYNESKLSS
jgi:hypothetical protein